MQIQTNASNGFHFQFNPAAHQRQPSFEFMPLRALLLEGSTESRHNYEHLFKEIGFEEMEVAENFAEAFRCIEINHEPYDLIVVDQSFWGDDELNLKLCKLIRANNEYQRTAIVMLSQHCDSETVVAAFRAGVDEFIPKYTHPLELKRVAWRAVLERRHMPRAMKP
jgi:DNA-binding response OmpR family regulator